MFINRESPEGTFTAKLKSDHAGFISKIWCKFKPEQRLEFLKNHLENSLSVGLFLKDEPSQPVSWAFLSNFGHITAVHTLKEH